MRRFSGAQLTSLVGASVVQDKGIDRDDSGAGVDSDKREVQTGTVREPVLQPM